MRALLLLVFICFFNGIVIAQVGIGTTSPSAMLDIKSTSLTTPNNKDGLLIPKINVFPTTNPGAAQDGMMVYVTGAGTQAKGFYYWDNATSSWLSFLSSSEWTDNGTYLSPADGNSEDVTIGGTDDTSARLTVRSNKSTVGLFTNSGSQDISMIGVNTTLTNASTQISSFTAGNYKSVTNNGSGSAYGDYNRISGTGTGIHYGELSILEASGSGTHYGNSTVLGGTGAGTQYALYNVINNTGSGDHYGMSNILNGSSTGFQTGIRNTISNSGNSFHTGVWNQLSGSGSGTKIATNNVISNGSGNHYGTYNNLSSTGTGLKIGSYNSIVSSAGGMHYGVYSEVLKSGSFAGYFIGNVAIGTTPSNIYRLPVSRGVSGQLMQTDASGNVNWVNQSSIGVQEVNDLLDGRSDNDGSDPGSSVFLGINAGAADDFTDNKNVGFGYQSMIANTTGERNIAIGYESLKGNTTGSFQVALGYLALANSNGNGNVAIGDQSLRTNSAGTHNLGAGYYSLNANISGSHNVALGNQSMLNNIGGTGNTAVGAYSLGTNTIGNNNIAFGASALYSNTDGSYNIAIGYIAGMNTQSILANTPSNNIIIGNNIDLPDLSGSNQLNIGNLIYGTDIDGSGQINSTGNIGIGIQVPMDRLEVEGKIRVSSSATSSAQFRNDDNFNHLADNNIDFGDQEDAWMVSSLEGGGENSGIYGDRDFVTVWAPADSNRLIRFIDEDFWADNDGNPYNNNAELAYIDASGQFIQASDKNRKQNINQIENALTKILEVNGYTYEFKLNEQDIKKNVKLVKTSGVIAQELYKVLPEAVQISENGEYFVHYAGIIPLLIESIKEQQKIIERQQQDINKLKELEERILLLESKTINATN